MCMCLLRARPMHAHSLKVHLYRPKRNVSGTVRLRRTRVRNATRIGGYENDVNRK